MIWAGCCQLHLLIQAYFGVLLLQSAKEVQSTSGNNILGSGSCTVSTLLRLMPVMVLRLVAVAFGCPWREQGEIVQRLLRSQFVWAVLGRCPFLSSDYSKSFCFLCLEGRKDRFKLWGQRAAVCSCLVITQNGLLVQHSPRFHCLSRFVWALPHKVRCSWHL